jgi:hypothetical protein
MSYEYTMSAGERAAYANGWDARQREVDDLKRQINRLELQAWYHANNCTHAHCPQNCEHPQPLLHDGELLCGRCLILLGERSPMIPCTPAICD